MRSSRHIRGNRVLLYIIVCGVLFLSLWVAIFGVPSFRKFWNMPQTPLIFPDTHTLITGAESHALGYDPMFENIADPYDREMNYPRIWQCLFWLPINRDHLVLLAGTFILLFFLGIFLFLKTIDTQTALFLGAVTFSPSAIFGLQSGNNDLVIFFFVALALRLGDRSKLWGSIAMFFAAILKVFPIFGLAQLLTEDKRDFWRILMPLVALFLIYCWISLDDFRQIYSVTPRGRSGAYGVYVLPMMIEKTLQKWTVFPELRTRVIAAAPIFFYGVAGLILLISLYALFGKNASSRPVTGVHISPFRVGACIYIGSFLLASNWNYRMIFLIFTIPQLFAWLSIADIRLSRILRITLACILFSCWSMFIQGILGSYIFILDEIANWIVFSGLIYLFLASLPNWLFDALLYLVPIRR